MEQAQMEKVRRADERLAAGRRPKAEGLQYSVDRRALVNAVRTEGTEIMTESGAEYWRDQERKYPHLRGARTDMGENLAGTRNKYGMVSYRARWDAEQGRLVRERRVDGKWVEVEGKKGRGRVSRKGAKARRGDRKERGRGERGQGESGTGKR